MTRIEDYLSLGGKLAKEFKFWLNREKEMKDKNTMSYTGTYSSKYCCYDSWLKQGCTIFFYEWSDVNGTKRFFSKIQDFYDFLEQSKIDFPPYGIRTEMEKNEINHIACPKGKATIVVGATKEELVKAMENAIKPQSIYPYQQSYTRTWNRDDDYYD